MNFIPIRRDQLAWVKNCIVRGVGVAVRHGWRVLLFAMTICSLQAAQIKISELPLSVSPTDQTYIEIADMLATPKSAKYLLTNLTTRAEFLDATNFFTLTATNIYVTNLFANITYTSNLFVTNIFATNIFATNIFNENTYVSNLFTTNIFATNIFTTNLFATNIYTSNFFATNIFVTNIYTTNMFISTNITIDQHITLKNGATIFFTNNTYVTTNTFLFVNSTGGVVSAVLNGTNGVKVTNGTNITANLAAGANVTLTTNSGVITIASAGSGLGTPGTVISGNTPSSLNDNIFIPDDLTGTNGVWATFATLLTSLPGYTGGGTNYLGDDGEFHPFIFDYVYAGTLIVETNMVFTNLTASTVLGLDASKNVTNIPAGVNGQVLIYDSASATGAKWTNASIGTGSTKYLNFIRPDYGDGAGAVPQTNTYTASGLMHYTFSGSAETNVNWVVYEASVPPDIDTSVAMTATYAFVSGGSDADVVTFHITYALGVAGTALTTGTSIATSPIAMTVTPTTPASGDVQTTAAVTLTGWAASMTAGTPLQIRVARLNTANDDTARDLYLRIAYGSTQ